jgi:hypothetical protein
MGSSIEDVRELTPTEKKYLQNEFDRRWPGAVEAITNEKQTFHLHATLLWLGLKVGYILGRDEVKEE